MKTPTQRRKKQLRIVTAALSLALVCMVAGYFALPTLSGCSYTIVDGDNAYSLSASGSTQDVLKQAGITLGDADKVTVEGGSAKKTITIQRSRTVSIDDAGDARTVTVYGGTVGSLLDSLSISLGAGDTLTADGSPASTLMETYDGMALVIDRTTTKTQVTTEPIPYETVSYLDPTLPVGQTVVQTPGQEGENQITTSLTYENGQLAASTVTSTTLLSAPVTEVLLVGSKEETSCQEGETAIEIYKEPEPSPSPSATVAAEAKLSSSTASAAGSSSASGSPSSTATPAATEASAPTPAPTPEPTPEPSAAPASSGNTITTSDGQVLSYSSTLSVQATAYTGGGVTATGTSARYGAIAVDPKVIPYGTKMYIISDDGKWIYGVATAEDCGGAIKGNIIDLYFDDYNTCIQFGRRNCTVYILD